MKIASAAVSVVKVPLESAYQAAGRQVGTNWHVLARVRTTDGVEGFGYIVSLNAMFVGAVASATRELAGLLPGMSVLDTEAAWQRMARAGDWIGPAACCITPSHHWTSRYGMRPARPWACPCARCWVDSATGCRPMPAMGSGTRCRSIR